MSPCAGATTAGRASLLVKLLIKDRGDLWALVKLKQPLYLSRRNTVEGQIWQLVPSEEADFLCFRAFRG